MATIEEKLRAVRREVRMRRRVYPGLIQRGKMSRGEADAELSVFEEIERDLEAALTAARPELDLAGGKDPAGGTVSVPFRGQIT